MNDEENNQQNTDSSKAYHRLELAEAWRSSTPEENHKHDSIDDEFKDWMDPEDIIRMKEELQQKKPVRNVEEFSYFSDMSDSEDNDTDLEDVGRWFGMWIRGGS